MPGSYTVRPNCDVEPLDDPRDRGVAWEVVHRPTGTVESDWCTPKEAFRECARLADLERAESRNEERG